MSNIKKEKLMRSWENPLVIVVAISEYDGFPNLDGPPQDYHSIAFGMNYKRGYTMIYFDKNNNLHQIGCSSNDSTSKYDASTLKQDPNFKIEWTTAEIDQFNDKILEKLNKREKEITTNNSSNNSSNSGSKPQKQVKYDALVYFISGHGDSNLTFYDSNAKKLNLEIKFFNKFNNENCEYFYGKPKAFIVDCCRGKKEPKKNKTDEYKQIESQSKNNKNKYNHNESNGTMDVSLGLDNLNSSFIKYGCLNESEIMAHDHHIQDDMRLVFSTIDRYKAVDATFGGYLIRGIMTTLCRSKNMNNAVSFNQLIQMTNALINKKLIGDHFAQAIEDVNHWKYDLKLKVKITVL